jgi:retron-type reverse transcriptase
VNKTPSKNPAILEVANYIQTTARKLAFVLYASKGRDSQYTRIIIPKRNGSQRILHAANPAIKQLQQLTYEKLSENFSPTDFAKGFVPGESIITNAYPHRRRSLILKFDIKDFFPSITYPRVRGMYMSYPFNFSEDFATILAQISCLDNNGGLPQGGVTSPYISNMLCRRLDKNLAKYARRNRFIYTRYADDITLSTNKKNTPIDKVKEEISKIIEAEKFTVNRDKTRVLFPSNRQIITGIVVNDGVNVPRKYIRNIRAILHNCKTYGVLSQAKKDISGSYSCPPFKVVNQSGGLAKFLKYPHGTELSIPEVKKVYLRHLKGKLLYIYSVAKANRGITNEIPCQGRDRASLGYERRIKIFRSLMNQFNSIVYFEKLGAELSLNIDNEKSPSISKYKIDSLTRIELDTLCEEKVAEDVRFFYSNPMNPSLPTYKKNMERLLNSPPPDEKIIASYFSLLSDSESNVLGGIVHNKDIKKGDFNEFYEQYKSDRVYLTNHLRKIFDNLLRGPVDTFRNPKLDEFNFFKDAKMKRIYIAPFKQKTRFSIDPQSDMGTSSLLVVADSIIKANQANSSDRMNMINYDEKLVQVSHYTDVRYVKYALVRILESMITHSKEDQIFVKYIVDRKTKRFTLVVNNLDPLAIGNACQRNQIANGKIKAAIRYLHGIADYYISANFQGGGWKRINMLTGSIEPTDTLEGFTHTVEFK